MRTRRTAVLALLVAVALATAAAAYAGFSSSVSVSEPLASATLQSPTGVTATQVSCRNNQPPQIQVAWNASASAFATGYTISRGTASTGPFTPIGSVGSTTLSFTDPSTTLAYSTPYYYVVDSTFQSWTATSTVAAVTTLGNKCR
jgi:hypothetical protein